MKQKWICFLKLSLHLGIGNSCLCMLLFIYSITVLTSFPSTPIISGSGEFFKILLKFIWSRILSIVSYDTPISPLAVCPFHSLALLCFSIISWGTSMYLAIFLTSVLYKSAIGNISAPPSPYLWSNPVAIHLCLQFLLLCLLWLQRISRELPSLV